MNIQTELLSCPFCGAEADIWVKYSTDDTSITYTAHAECSGCRARSDSYVDNDIRELEEAIKKVWNWRSATSETRSLKAAIYLLRKWLRLAPHILDTSQERTNEHTEMDTVLTDTAEFLAYNAPKKDE